MVEENIELAKSWNNFIVCLVEAREIWYNEIKGATRRDVAFVPRSPGMKVLASSRTASFSTVLSKLIDYWRGSGGLSVLSVVLPEEAEVEEEEKEEDDHEVHVEAHIETERQEP